MNYPDCYGKKPLDKPGKGCTQCPHWNGCLPVTWITDGKGHDAWLAERKKEEKKHEENSHSV